MTAELEGKGAAELAAAMAPMKPAPSKATKAKVTLIGTLGLAAATSLIVNVAREESGREVTVTAAPDERMVITHVRGKQYLDAYRDVAGIWTACDGIAYVPARAKFTEAQCSALLEAKLTEAAAHVMACTPGLKGPGHDNQRTAAMLLAHNIGWPAFCRSTARARFNLFQYRAACDAFLPWDMAGGRHVPGLKLRRQRERAICLKDVRA